MYRLPNSILLSDVHGLLVHIVNEKSLGFIMQKKIAFWGLSEF